MTDHDQAITQEENRMKVTAEYELYVPGYEGGAMPVEEFLLEAAAVKLIDMTFGKLSQPRWADGADLDTVRAVTRTISDKVNEMLEARLLEVIGDMVEKVLADSFYETNDVGQVVVKSTVRDKLIAQAQEQVVLGERKGSYGKKDNLITNMLDKAVNYELTNVIGKEIEHAKDVVRKEVGQAAADIIAKKMVQ